MSLLSQLFLWFISDIWTTITSLLIAYMVYKMAKFYYQYYSLPPGPFPLPLIGNLLAFKTKQHCNYVLTKFAKKYGPVYTLYLGNSPQIIITDAIIAREAFRKKYLSGRPQSYFGNSFKTDIIFSDYGNHWEALRSVAHSAILKYSSNEQLVNVAVDCVDQTVQTMLEREGPNKPIDPFNYIYLTFLNILAISTFGKTYSIDDPVFKQLKYMLTDVNEELATRRLLWEISPIVRWIDQKMIRKNEKNFSDLIDQFIDKYRLHYNDYDSSIERDICDALITAKNNALREAKESAQYLTDENLALAIFDLFFAGTNTSQNTFQWILLLLSYYPSMQTKLRQEIDSIIGDRMPTHEDRQRCHYVMAFIAETLRFRNVVPGGVFHKAMITSKIGDYTIQKDMPVFAYQGFILRDDKYWENSETFIPERFLDSDGHYMTARSPAFIPFGVGRRICLGEKLAIVDLFLVLVRFLQSTQNYDIVLDSHNGLDILPNGSFNDIYPHKYTIVLKTK
ncbi:cytochrome P450 2A9-like [Oppia nitens]|uniref:cytochrome P450 2A9-like n=1 Tax=Oppia nitens TaxID=1686743 RepID=UPI0023DC9450|nr:cytochrome P450 2A9-like [Oppia nitens]